MSLSWPWALLALLVIPLVFAVWWLTRRRKRRAVVRVTSIALVRTALPGRSRWRRRIPAALLTLGLAVLAVGAARPQATVPVASSSATIMLALDVSGSMCSTDVQPNRITAAEHAATDFIDSQTGGPRIGLVTFAGTAVVLVPPTAARQAADRGVRVFTIGYGTDNPAPLACSSDQFGGFGGGTPVGFGGGGGASNPFDADYAALMKISRTTGGTFYRAEDAGQLSTALARLPDAFTIVRKHIDIASWFAAGGGLLVVAAVALSLWWNRTRRT